MLITLKKEIKRSGTISIQLTVAVIMFIGYMLPLVFGEVTQWSVIIFSSIIILCCLVYDHHLLVKPITLYPFTKIDSNLSKNGTFELSTNYG